MAVTAEEYNGKVNIKKSKANIKKAKGYQTINGNITGLSGLIDECHTPTKP